MEDTVLSIIVPAYNVRRYLSRCMESIVNQSYHNIQVILVDDGSTDGTSDLCDQWSARDSRIESVHRANGGLAAARNSGLERVKGEYVLFVDSDDWLAADAAELLLTNALQHHSDVVCFDLLPMSAEGEFPRKYVVSQPFPNIEVSDGRTCLEQLYTRHINNYVWCFLYKVDFLETHKLSFDGNIRFLEDALFTNQMLQAASVVSYFGTKPLYYYYMRADSLTHKLGSVHAEDGLAVVSRILQESPLRDESFSFYDYIIDLFFFVELKFNDRKDEPAKKARLQIKSSVLSLSTKVPFSSLSKSNKEKIVLLRFGCFTLARRIKFQLDRMKVKLFAGKKGFGAAI